MKRLLFLLLSLVVLSCAGPSNEDQVEKVIKNYLENNAFKVNDIVTFHKFDLISSEKVNGHFAELDYVQKLQNQSGLHNKLVELEYEKIKAYTEQLNKYNYISLSLKKDQSIEKINEHTIKGKRYLEEADELLKMIDTTVVDSAQLVKVYIKASYKNQKYENLLDTMYFLIDHNYKIVPAKNIE